MTPASAPGAANIQVLKMEPGPCTATMVTLSVVANVAVVGELPDIGSDEDPFAEIMAMVALARADVTLVESAPDDAAIGAPYAGYDDDAMLSSLLAAGTGPPVPKPIAPALPASLPAARAAPAAGAGSIMRLIDPDSSNRGGPLFI